MSLAGELRYERFGRPDLLAAVSRAFLAESLSELGTFVEGIVYGEEAVRIAEVVDHPFSLIRTLYGLGHVYLRQGDFPRALPALERGLGVCQAWHMPLLFPRTAAHLGYAYALSGRLAEALPLLEQAVEASASLGDRHDHLPVAWLSEALLLADRLEEASQRAQQALELAQAHKERGHEAWTLRLLGEIAAQSTPPQAEPATAAYQQGLALAEELGMCPLQAHCHLGLGTLYRHVGRHEQARAELSAAIALYRALEMTFWLPRAKTALAEVGERQ